MLANSPQTRLDITQTQQIARNGGLSLQTACKREVWGTASGGPYHWGGGGGGATGPGTGIIYPYSVRPPRYRSVGEHNSNFTMVYGIYITIVTGANLNQLITFGGPTLYESHWIRFTVWNRDASHISLYIYIYPYHHPIGDIWKL